MSNVPNSVAIIGGGAAGCFCAVNIKRRRPDFSVTVYEAGPRLMAKLAITGGGRCNLTNSFQFANSLRDVYPRGFNLMKRALHSFSVDDTLAWFRSEGIGFVTQDDGCVFPASQDAMQIVRTLERLLRQSGVTVRCNSRIEDLSTLEEDIKVVTTGGGALSLLRGLPLEIVPPVPSLFTLKIADEGLRSLMGTVVGNATLGIAGTTFRSQGILLLTDWGISGPATLKLSSYAARYLADNQYKSNLYINYLSTSENEACELLHELSASGSRMMANTPPEGLTERLWKHILDKAGIPRERRWAELGGKGFARLAATLTSDSYQIVGRARFKEEFVTCGGVSLNSVDLTTLEARDCPGLYFAGEVLDIDAVTGGFNLQAAWSTAMTVVNGIIKQYERIFI